MNEIYCNLRKLEKKDAPLMLEWMKDNEVTQNLKTDFSSKTLKDCQRYIENSLIDVNNINLAIVNEKNEYYGTVSLKNIDYVKQSAEFAITIRKIAMGKGYSKYAMKEIIKKGFKELKLKYIYWYVDINNERAIKFYNKNGYNSVSIKQIAKICPACSQYVDSDYIWYLESL